MAAFGRAGWEAAAATGLQKKSQIPACYPIGHTIYI